MKKNQIKCLVCGGKIVFDEQSKNYKCNVCNANHSSELFDMKEKSGWIRLHLSKIRILFAILGALYLLYFLFRFFIY